MTQVTVSLEDGFAQDRVLIRVDGTTAFEGSDVTTRMQTGLAAAVQVETSDASSLEVELPTRGLSRAIDIDGSSTPYVRVSTFGAYCNQWITTRFNKAERILRS